MKVSNQELADLVYESAMYKLHEIEQINFIKDLWDNAEIFNASKAIRSRKIKLDYKRR